MPFLCGCSLVRKCAGWPVIFSFWNCLTLSPNRKSKHRAKHCSHLVAGEQPLLTVQWWAGVIQSPGFCGLVWAHLGLMCEVLDLIFQYDDLTKFIETLKTGLSPFELPEDLKAAPKVTSGFQSSLLHVSGNSQRNIAISLNSASFCWHQEAVLGPTIMRSPC